MLCTVYVYVRITEHFNSEVSNHQVAQKCIYMYVQSAYIWHSVIYYLFIIILIILYFRLLYAIAVE